MKKATLVCIMTTIFLIPSMVTASASPSPLDKVQFIKIAPINSRAVIKGEDGKLLVIKQGDMIGDSVVVNEIVAGRIVLEETTATGTDIVIVRMEKGKSRIERLRKQPDQGPTFMAPGNSGP